MGCTVCEADAAVSDACPHCGAVCCADHRDPAAHDCPGTEAGTTTGWQIALDAGGPETAANDAHSGEDTSIFRPGVGLAVLAVVVVALAAGAVAYAPPAEGGVDVGEIESSIEDRTNDERTAAGVGAVESDPELSAIARAHSEDMRDRGFVGHVDPDGVGHAERVRAAGIECNPGENIYRTRWGSLVVSESAFAGFVVRGWLGSEGHRETLLRERYTRQGVGVAAGERSIYVTQLFC